MQNRSCRLKKEIQLQPADCLTMFHASSMQNIWNDLREDSALCGQCHRWGDCRTMVGAIWFGERNGLHSSMSDYGRSLVATYPGSFNSVSNTEAIEHKAGYRHMLCYKAMQRPDPARLYSRAYNNGFCQQLSSTQYIAKGTIRIVEKI